MNIRFHRDVLNAIDDIKTLKALLLALAARVEALEKKRQPKDKHAD